MADAPDGSQEPLLDSFLHRPLPAELQGLADLALDLRWNVSARSDRLWQILDPDAWELTENPFMILQNVTQARLEEAVRDPAFMEEFRRSREERRRSLDDPGWFGRHYADSGLKTVAYFSMEFGISEALPIYSGGLGLLAGDHLKTASDMGVPLVAVGLFYQQGYFRQSLTSDGWQLEVFPYNDPTVLPVLPVHTPEGGWLRISLQLPGRTLRLRLWEARVGRIRLYLLDSNDPLNSPWDRGITASLYPSGSERGEERRLIQEIVLGIGGWQALEALGIAPEVCHLNEGHAAFVVLARALSFMRRTGLPFPVARWATRAGNVFTTHTAMPAGFDRFSRDLIDKYVEPFATQAGLSIDALMDLGRQNAGDPGEPLNIAYLAMRCGGAVNAVSRLHQQVSRRIFQGLYGRWPPGEVPVGYVTNGVHVPSWDSLPAQDLWEKVCGENSLMEGESARCARLDALTASELWAFRSEARRRLIEYIRRRLVRQAQEHGESDEAIRRAQNALNPDVLTLGFARRFTAYKRPTLLLRDPERLANLLRRSERPIQLVVAGKAHPNDQDGKRLVQAMAQFAARPDLCQHVVFLEDYDIALMQQFAAGVDLWINTPRRPWEASGTSGMKLLVNGGLNFSELDGWWVEAYAPEVGWALGDAQEHAEPDWDAREAGQLYETLERDILPAFYDRDREGIPQDWLKRMRASMSQLTPRFSSYRMVREYVEQIYLPAAQSYRRRIQENAALAVALNDWQTKLDANWNTLHFGGVHVTRQGEQWHFEVDVYCSDLNPDGLRVELYAEPRPDSLSTPIVMDRTRDIAGAVNGYIYTATVPASRPAEDYTPRILPFHPEAHLPLEDAHILWQR